MLWLLTDHYSYDLILKDYEICYAFVGDQDFCVSCQNQIMD